MNTQINVVTKLTLMWNREINDFEFCAMRMFKTDSIEDANTLCYEDGKYVEWDVSETDAQCVFKYLKDIADGASLNLVDEIEQNLLIGGTLIRFRTVDGIVQVWMAM